MEMELLAVLVVEDEVLIQEMVRDALSEGGFETETTTSGEDAIGILEGTNSKHRALITDI